MSARRAGRIGGVIHAAGVNWFSKVRDLDRNKLLEAVEIKVSAAWNLHALTLNDDVDFFILFSSVSAVWGSVDLAHYTASNHFLDVLCHQRRRLGQTALSIDWGPWADVGMSAHEREENLLSMLGLKMISPTQALAHLERVLVEDRTQCVIVEFDWARFQSFVDFSLSPSLFKRIKTNRSERALALAHSLSVDKLVALPPAEAHQTLVALLRRQLSAVLLVPPGSDIDENTRFNFIGMDSLMAMAFCARLETQLGFEIPAMTAYNYPTLGKMAEFLNERIHNLPPSSEQRIYSDATLFSLDQTPSSYFRLFCFPYAGAGPSIFSDWNDAVAENVSIVPLQLPGREHRLSEPPITSIEQLVQAIADTLEPHTHTPYGFFGHSLGALLGFEVAQELARRALPLPQPLILSGCTPARSDVQDTIHQLDDDAFVAELSCRFGIVPESGWDPALQEALLPALRADIKMAETSSIQSSAPIPCQLHVFGGREDPLAPPDQLSEWSNITTTVPLIHLFDGDHMFLRGSAKADVIAMINNIIHQRLQK